LHVFQLNGKIVFIELTLEKPLSCFSQTPMLRKPQYRNPGDVGRDEKRETLYVIPVGMAYENMQFAGF